MHFASLLLVLHLQDAEQKKIGGKPTQHKKHSATAQRRGYI